MHPLYTFITIDTPLYTHYTCIYTIYTPLNTSKHPLNTLNAPYIHPIYTIGAIGSVQKVSINYVSADVRTTSRLAATAVQYGVPLLFSNKLHKVK